jgi:hypothetical protein
MSLYTVVYMAGLLLFCPTIHSSPLILLLCLAAVAPFCFADDEIV